MLSAVVPFRDEDAKRRLEPLPRDARTALARAMLDDVVAACEGAGASVVVAREGAQGEAVETALRGVESGQIFVVNADLPCARPRDLLTLLGALPEGGLALVGAVDGTTNALALASPSLFAPLYGPGSAERFRARAARLGVPSATARIPNLAEDADTLADLERLADKGRLGRRTAAALEQLRAGLAR
jgi:2-phospho-L-lactate guanylyltransferase (CobY/MobA/RfbA family)